jgi:hypothetical protein
MSEGLILSNEWVARELARDLSRSFTQNFVRLDRDILDMDNVEPPTVPKKKNKIVKKCEESDKFEGVSDFRSAEAYT